MNQALIEPSFEILNLKLHTDTDPHSRTTQILHNRKSHFNAVAEIEDNTTASIIGQHIRRETKVIGAADHDTDLCDHLNDVLYREFGRRLETAYKIYLINENNNFELYGRGHDIDDDRVRTALIYSIGLNDSTIPHELGHSLGLYHTFSNNSEFTFEENRTDNLMDYSDMGSTKIPLTSTYHWQWKILQSRAEKESLFRNR
ncbi:hypothetical protein [uncultured Chryseobacterium sp.]|uniref:hypothetical protein n=1 Tax=uncultured Chryseobacterium sp. TaxID=259322 RepID=UPI0025CDE25E|nr:hypothetical protein [uncultured Chryseobacterium sp.]